MDNIDLNKPLFQCTLGDLKIILSDVLMSTNIETMPEKATKNYVYGIQGLAKLFGCSQVTAQRIKSSGVIDDAVSQIGGVIVVDADYALDLLKVSKKYRSNLKKRLQK